MGYTTRITCENCFKTEEFKLGAGMRTPFDIDMLIEYVSSAKEKQVLETLKTLNGTLEDCKFELYVCPTCKTLHSRLHYKIKYKEEIYQKAYTCSKCRTSLIMMPDELLDLRNYNCKKCGQNKLHFDFGETLWD